MFSFEQHPAKKWVTAILLFVGVAVLADQIWTHGIIFKSDAFEAGKVWRCFHAQDDAIPILGASTTRAAFIPELLAVDGFNYGMNGSSYDVVDVLLQAEIRKPKTTPVIIGMTDHVFHSVGDVSKFIPFAWQPEVRRALEENHAMSWRFWLPGIRYFGYYDWYLKDFLSERTGLTRKVVKGYEHKFNAVSFDAGRFAEAIKERREAGYGFEEDRRDTERLRQRIQSAPQRWFILVYLPLHRSCLENFKGSDAFAAAIEAWRRLPNVTVLDYTRLDYPDDYFVDTLHLNERGATEFTRLFARDFDRMLKADGRPGSVARAAVNGNSMSEIR